MLTVSDLHVAYGETEVVRDVSLAVADGEAVAIIGSNGAGKTTLLKAVCGLLPVRGGQVDFDGRQVAGKPAYKLARLGMAYVPAERHLFPDMPVIDNLSLGAFPSKPDAERLAYVFELFPRLRDRRKQMAGTMSGGEQQMLAVGRALMSRPKLLLLDEPTTGLAPILAEEAYTALAQLRSEDEATIVVAEQQVPLALELAARGYVLEDGRIQLEGGAAELEGNPRVRVAYLGIA
jgi:branched-chain amino acid transport system ATP-binding protein